MSKSEIAELEARHAALQAELAERTRARDELGRMLAEADGRIAPRRWSMWIMIAIGAVGVLVIALGGISIYRATRTEKPPTNGVAERFELFTNEVCACKDRICVEQIVVALDRWSKLVMEERPPVVFDAETNARLSDLGERYAACVRRIRQ